MVGQQQQKYQEHHGQAKAAGTLAMLQQKVGQQQQKFKEHHGQATSAETKGVSN